MQKKTNKTASRKEGEFYTRKEKRWSRDTEKNSHTPYPSMHHFLALVDFQETILQWKEAAEAKSKRGQLYDCPGGELGVW